MKNIEPLARSLREYQSLYDAGIPAISDEAFDLLVAELRVAAPSHPALSYLGRPLSSAVTASAPMLSLQKCYTDEDLHGWLGSIPEGSLRVDIQPKLDGMSLSLVYEYGKLAKARTRGDGTEGDDVTHNALHLNGVPAHIPHMGKVEIRGEVVIKREYFATHYADSYANARNFVAGQMLRKDADVETLRRIDFVVYDWFDTGIGDPIEQFALTKEGFTPCPAMPVLLTSDVAGHVRERIASYTSDLAYEIDGAVIKAASSVTRKLMGATAHHPKWAIAYKVQGESSTSTVTDVIWQTSRSGIITPVAVVAPLRLSGVTVERVSLHNMRSFEALQLTYHCRVMITRRGGVIPHIECVVGDAPSRCQPFDAPKRCPSCGSPTVRRGEFLHCNTIARCPDIDKGILVFWARTMGMLGWGPELVSLAYHAGILKTPLDFYRVTEKTLQSKGIAGVRTMQKLVAEVVRTSQGADPVAFLVAAGIDTLGKTTAQRLLGHFGTVEAVLAWSEAPFEPPTIPNMGLVTLEACHAGLRRQYDMLSWILEYLDMRGSDPAASTDGPLHGTSFVFTGRMAGMGREDARARVRDLGGATPDDVIQSLSVLVVGDESNNEQRIKRDKAERFNAKGAKIRILSESEFMRLLHNAMEIEND